MTDENQGPEDHTPPDLAVKPARRSLIERMSIVWVIPVVALLIALGVAWQSYNDRGPVIEIAFGNASGVTANETEVRFRDVAVGVVEKVAFTDTLDQVLVSVRLDKDVADFVDADAQFWVVRPEVTAEGVSGLDTVLTGVFIEGIWDNQPGEPQDRFDGLAEAPLSRDGKGGLSFLLRAAGESGLTENAPIIYRGIEVGRIGRAQVSEDGSTVQAEAIVFEPHNRLITSSTRFWDTSGFSFKLGPNGAEIDFSSIASLLSGGVTFQTLVSGGEQLENGATFVLYPDEGAARASLFSEEDGEALSLTAIFEDNVSGLAVDAPVDLGGLRIGRVTAVSGLVDEDRFGDRKVRLAATLSIRPGRLGLRSNGEVTAGQALAFLDRRVGEGLRARLASASILTGGLKVELVEDPEAEPARIDTDAQPNPVIPTTASDIADVAATAEGVFERINALPIEELLQSAIGVMDNVSRLIASDDLRQVPSEVRGLLADARGLVGSDEVQQLPSRLSGVIGELEGLVASLNEEQAVTKLLAAVETVSGAAESVTASVEGLPALLDQVRAVAAKAEALPLEDLTAQLTSLADSASTLLADDATRALPASVNASLAELSALLTDLREQQVATSAAQALDAARQAANDVSASIAGLPELIEKIDAVAQMARNVPLDALTSNLSDLLDSADALIGTDAARQLPADLSASLAELRLVLEQLREGGVVENANRTLASASDAADSIARAADGLPSLLQRAQSVLTQAGEAIAGYDARNGVGRDVETTLREVQRAAAAVASLARALERNPNSLLFGR